MDLAAATVQTVATDELIVSPTYQLRERLEAWKVEEYAAVFERLPPLLAGFVHGRLYLLDGQHRLAAARQLGRQAVEVRIVETDEDNAYALAVRANTAHGLPLKTKEKKQAARGILVRFPQRSDRWIAEDAGLSHPTVTSLRAELEAGGKIYHLGYSLGQEGKRYPCTCTRCRPVGPMTSAEAAAGAGPTERIDAGASPAYPEEPARAAGPGMPDVSVAATRSAPVAVLAFNDVPDASPSQLVEGHALADTHGAYPAYPAGRASGSGPAAAAEPNEAPFACTVGPVAIRQGDARELLDWRLPPVHLVVTSPPYNVGTAYSLCDDRLAGGDYLDLLGAAWRACYAVMAPGARIAVVVPFGVGRKPWLPLAARVADLLGEAGFDLRGQIVWDKGSSGGRTTWGSFRLPSDPCLRDTTEAIVLAHKGRSDLPLPPGLARHDSEGAYSPLLADPALFMGLAQDHWAVPPESATRVGHPAPFPVALAERLIRLYAYPASHVLDPFAGSGSTGVAALRLGCRATLVDIDGDYCRLAETRCRRAFEERPGGLDHGICRM